MHALVRPRSGTNITVFVMGVCVRVRVARVVRVSEGTLPTIVNTLRSSKEPLGTIRRNPNYPPPGLLLLIWAAVASQGRLPASWRDPTPTVCTG